MTANVTANPKYPKQKIYSEKDKLSSEKSLF